MPSTELRIKSLKSKLKGDLLTFGKVLRPKAHWAAPSPIHYKVESLVLDHSKKKINIVIPRGLAKSILVGEEYPLYHIFMEEIGQPKLVVLVSKTQRHSINRLQSIKDTISFSPDFKYLFGNWGEHTSRTWRNDEITFKDGSSIITRGMGQPIRGLNYPGGIRPTLIILDDPEDEHNTKTSEAMETNLRWLLRGALPALDTRYGRIIIIGTPLHQRCMVMTLEGASDWTSLRSSYLNVDENGAKYSLWPEMKSVKALEEERDSLDEIGRVSVWYMERQCEVTGDEDQLFKSEYIKYYNGDIEKDDQKESYLILESRDGVAYPEPKKIPINIFIGIDPASSTKQTADYSVIMVIGVDAEKDVYVIDYFRKRVTPLNLGNAIIKYFKKYNPKKVRIESVGYQEMLREYIKDRTRDEGMFIPGLEIKEMPRSSKSDRLESLEPDFARGKVFIKTTHTELLDELLLYPRGKHDDCLDALYLAMKKKYGAIHTTDKPAVLHTQKKYEPKGWMTV